MSLSFQMARGFVALPLLAALAALAWFAPAPSTAAATSTARIVLVSAAAASAPAACVLAAPPLRVALAPADLPLARRRDATCRA